MTAGSIGVPTIVPLRAPIPGQHKTCIDTNTKIELHSETEGASIYYTTNGSKPEPFGSHGPAAKSTFRYREPFRLASGRKTIKAVAVSYDGLRESLNVTKTFDVDDVEPDHPPLRDDGLEFVNDLPRDSKAKRDVNKFAHKMVTSKEAWNEISKMKRTEQMMDDMTMMGSTKYKPAMNGTLGTTGMLGTYGTSGSGFGFTAPRRLPPNTRTQAMRLQRETDFLKCVYCMASRPSDPYARFCNDCGNPVPPLPQTRIPPPEPGQMGTCVECNSLVPFNAPTCVICEAPLRQQNQPQASVRLGEKLVCLVCGTANPSMLSSCVTCEAKLPAVGKVLHMLQSAPSAPDPGSTRLVACSRCGRTNNNDARFCDWCGTKHPPKPEAPGTKVSCRTCDASNHPKAQFCGACGAIIAPPPRDGLMTNGITITNNQDPSASGRGCWLANTPASSLGAAVHTVATQTVGLFYPSERDMKKRMAAEEEKLAAEKLMRDRKPLLTAVSPGRGYWRKQMEHIVTHLKAHAQNNAEFRALIGEPRMGKIVSTAVHEDGYELSLTVNFAVRGSDLQDGDTGPGTAGREYLSAYTRGHKSVLSHYGSMDSVISTDISNKPRRKITKKKVKKPVSDKLSSEDRQLLQELGAKGEGRPSEVQQLLDEGADPCVRNKDGFPALHLAVLNSHIDALPILVQEGADINTKGPTRGNTALHEGVSIGSLDVIEALLGCGANTQKKNEKGETAYDLAVQTGQEAIGKKLTASLGQTALNKLIKPKAAPGGIF